MSKSAAERQRDSRQRKRDQMLQKTENVTCHDVTPSQDAPQSTNGDEVVAEHLAIFNSGKTSDRMEPRPDWDTGEDTTRQPIPGDVDYEGVCKQVNGAWGGAVT